MKIPNDATHYHRRLGYLQDVFGRHAKPKLWVDGEWKKVDLLSILEPKDFKKIQVLNNANNP